MTLRITKVVLILLVGLWGLIGGIQNFIQAGAGFEAVAAVLSPDLTTVSGLASWQTIENPLLIWIAWAVIPLAKIGGAALCLSGAYSMWLSRSLSSDSFQNSKSLALAGCGVILAMLFGGFIVSAETYFQLWQTEFGGLVLSTAFRYIGCVGIVAVFVQQPEAVQNHGLKVCGCTEISQESRQ